MLPVQLCSLLVYVVTRELVIIISTCILVAYIQASACFYCGCGSPISIPPGGQLSVALNGHWVACGLNPIGLENFFFLISKAASVLWLLCTHNQLLKCYLCVYMLHFIL